MKVLAIDPGPETSGWVLYDTKAKRVIGFSKASGTGVTLGHIELGYLPEWRWDHLVIEQVESYGIAGGSLLRTAEVGGRFYEMGLSVHEDGPRVHFMPRREVCRILSVHGKNKDSQVRHAMIARFGGTKRKAVGLKASPGPLYGISSHAWQALGLAVAWAEVNP